MKSFSRKVIFAVMLVLMFFVGSGNAGNFFGTVYSIIPGGTIIYFRITGATYAGCATNQRYVIDTTSTFGKNAYALILSSYLAGKSVGVITPGTCTIMPNDAEDVNNLYTQ